MTNVLLYQAFLSVEVSSGQDYHSGAKAAALHKLRF
jgi:hypothetical protein